MEKLKNWKWELVSPLMGGLLTLAFAPYNFSYTALPVLMFLYWVWSEFSPGKGMLIGYLFGLGMFGSGLWWVFVSIHEYGGADVISAILLTLLLTAVWALFLAVTGGIVAKIASFPMVWFRILAAALAWSSVEYLRGSWVLNGFPWLQIAYSQLKTPLAGYVPICGVYGVGFLLAASAFVVIEIVKRHLPLLHGLAFLLIVWSSGALLKDVRWTQAQGQPIKVTLIQGNVDQNQKWQSDKQLQTLLLYQELTEKHWDSQVIIWPETAIPAFFSQVQEFYLEPLAAAASLHHVDLVVSLPSNGEGNTYYNSVLSLNNMQRFYHKTHLLPFGEYLPLQPISGWILDFIQIPLGDFSPGEDRQALLMAGGFPFVTTVCYEDVFGELVSRQVSDAAYIVNVTNDALVREYRTATSAYADGSNARIGNRAFSG